MYLYNLYKTLIDAYKATLLAVTLSSAKTQSHNRATSLFFREGFLLDSLQKLTVDKWLRKLHIESMQFFNLNFYNYKLIRFFIDEVYKPLNTYGGKGDDLSYTNVVWNIFFLFFWILQLSIVLYMELFFFL